MARILIVGPGAIGGALACRWVEADEAVMIMGRTPASEAKLVKVGLTFTGTTGRSRKVRNGMVSARTSKPGPVDAVFVCVKNHQTTLAAKEAKPFVGPGTAIVALQNGVGHEKILRRAFGARRTVIGICYIAADRSGPLLISHNGGKDVHLARNESNVAAVEKAASLLRLGGWHVTVEDDEDGMLWTKVCFNAAGNPIAALCGASNGDLTRDPALKEMTLRALGEAVAAARADGKTLLYEDMEAAVTKGYPNDSKQRNSMLQDLQAGRKTEVDAILGPILAAAKRRKTKLALLPKLHRFVKGLEAAL